MQNSSKNNNSTGSSKPLVSGSTVGMNYVLPFGKHKDRKVKDVLEDEPSYLRWAHDTIDWFKLNKYVLSKVKEWEDNTDDWNEEDDWMDALYIDLHYGG